MIRAKFHNSISFFTVAVCCCVVSSCTSSDAQSISYEDSISYPSDFDEEGAKWTKSTSISESDLKLLSGYFKENSSMAEGPLISGDPTLYASNKGTKRFYWGRSSAERLEWIYIEFNGRKVTVQEGTGSPLGSPSD